MLMAVDAIASDLPSATQRAWIELQTPTFTFVSQASETRTRRLALELEQLHSTLATLAGGSPRDPRPTVIYVFDRSNDFRDYIYWIAGGPAPVSGFFRGREDVNFISIDASRRGEAIAVVFHEFAHEVINARLPGLPVWLDEGLAELYSTFRLKKDTAEIGRPIDSHLIRLGREPLIPVAALMAVNHDSPSYTERDRRSLFYAESWALTHMLLLGDDDLAARTRNFLRSLTPGTDPDAWFRAQVTDDLDALQNRLREYVAKRVFRYLKINLPSEEPTDIGPARSMPRAEIMTRLGELLASEDEPRPTARQHLELAVKLDPASGRALSTLALLAENRATWRDATRLHRQALSAAPLDPIVAVRAARFELVRGGDIKRAAEILDGCVTASPGYGPCWVRLTEALVAVGRTDDRAISLASRAVTMMPRRTETILNLVELLLAADRIDDAVVVVTDRLRFNPDASRRAWTRIAQDLLRRSHGRAAMGDLDAAAHDVDRVRQIAPWTERPSAILESASEADRAINRKRVRQRLEHARELFAAGDRDGARTLAQEIHGASTDDRELAGDAGRLLHRIDAPEPTPLPVPVVATVSPAEIDRLNQLLERGDLESAIELLEDLEARVSNDRTDWIDAKLAEVRRARDHNSFVEKYNHAIDLLDAGDRAGALRVLREVVAGTPQSADADEAHALIHRILSEP
jgi:tetratricopeptide (TPR) repeat protein